MSTRQEYSYQENQRAERRRHAEVARRNLRLANQRAERAAAVHRQAAADFQQARNRLDAVQHSAQAAAAEAATSRRALVALERDLEASRMELATAQRELQAEIGRISQLEAAAATEEVAMAAAIRDAERSLEAVAGLATAAVESLGELSPAERERLQTRQQELEQNIRQLESEVRFLAQDAAVAPAAMVTLLAMESNGYRLRDTLTREGLVSYFEREGEAHQLAVRVAKVERPGEASERWELVAETFGMKGEKCLYEIEDFETAVEDVELGRLQPGHRVYPKDDRGVRVTKGLPQPRMDLWRRPARAQRRRTRA